MKTIFKKSLVALALTGVAMSSAQAAITIGGKAEYANEGITTSTGAAQNITLGATTGTSDIVITVNTVVPQNGLIRVNFSAPVSTKSGFVMDLSSAAVVTPATGTVAVANYGADFVVYRVTNVGGLPVGETLTFNDSLKFTAPAIIAAKGLSVTASTETATGTAIESAKTEVVAELVQQVEFDVLTAGLLTKTIDVATKRTKFTSNGTTAALTIDTTDNAATTDAFEVAYTSQKYTLTGDFSWIKDTKTADAGIQAAAGVVTLPGACSQTSLTATTLKFSCNGTAVDPSVSFDLAANAASTPDADVYPVLNPTSFKLSAEVDFNNPAGLASNLLTPFADTAVGSWSLNGADVTIPYLVFGNVGGKDYNQVVQLTNKSSIEGAIYVDIYDGEGNAIAKNSKLTVTAKANSVTNLATELKALVAAAKYQGKVSVRVIAEVPSATAQVYAAYQDVATSERAIVVGLKN